MLDLSSNDELDLATLDEPLASLRAWHVEPRLASVRCGALELLDRGGFDEHARIAPTIDAAVDEGGPPTGAGGMMTPR